MVVKTAGFVSVLLLMMMMMMMVVVVVVALRVWFVLVCFRLFWFGLVCFVLVCFGLFVCFFVVCKFFSKQVLCIQVAFWVMGRIHSKGILKRRLDNVGSTTFTSFKPNRKNG